ncbi:MAG TPA: DUF4124 domain-containing protein [Steroidobacteraceae bacterium]|nr:DUF4124 domain-containing protein [Steroidobacteraceae bacterium]
MLRLTLILAAAAFAGAAHADVYKTVDAQGQPHYSDQWSPGAELIKTDHSHLITDDSSPPPAGDHASDLAKQSAAQRAVDTDVAAAKADECKKLQQQYDREVHARRILKPGSTSDNPDYMSDAEADAERVKVKEAMDDACGASQPSS